MVERLETEGKIEGIPIDRRTVREAIDIAERDLRAAEMNLAIFSAPPLPGLYGTLQESGSGPEEHRFHRIIRMNADIPADAARDL